MPVSTNPEPDDHIKGHKRHAAAGAMCACVHSVALSISFIWTFTLHQSLLAVAELEQAMLFELRDKRFGNAGKTVKDVHGTRLFWEWLEDGLFATAVSQRDALGHMLPKSEWGYLAQYNRIVGGIRLIQTRTLREPCQQHFASSFYVNCYPPGTIDLQAFGRPACESARSASSTCYNASEYADFVDIASNEGFVKDSVYDQFELWLDTDDPEDVLRQRIYYLEDRHWIDKQTETLESSILLLNNQRQPLFCFARVLFELTRSGYIEVLVSIETVSVEPYGSDFVTKVTLEIVYISLLLMLVLHVGKQMIRFFKRQGFEGFKSLYHKPPNVGYMIDLTNVCLGLVLACLWGDFVMRCSVIVNLMNDLQRPSDGSLRATRTQGVYSRQAWDDYHHDVANLEDHIHGVLSELTVIRDVASITLFALILRFLKTWETIPAMAAISKTSRVAFSHLFGLLLAVFVLVSLWAGAGMILFGHQIQDYKHFGTALQKTCQIVLVADHELAESMDELAAGFGIFWHWSLLVCMYVIVLNIVLAVLVDAFDEATQGMDHTSLFAQAVSACRQYVFWPRRVPQTSDASKRVEDIIIADGSHTATI